MMAPHWHAAWHEPHPMQRSCLKEISGLAERVSGFWHQMHLRGQPLRNTVVRIPGPSWRENRWILLMMAFSRPSDEGFVLIVHAFKKCRMILFNNKLFECQ
jgi:hypothetical protein